MTQPKGSVAFQYSLRAVCSEDSEQEGSLAALGWGAITGGYRKAGGQRFLPHDTAFVTRGYFFSGALRIDDHPLGMDSLPLRLNRFKLPRCQESDVRTGLSSGGCEPRKAGRPTCSIGGCLFRTLEDDSDRTSAGFAL